MMKRTFALMLSAVLLLGISLVAQQAEPGSGPGGPMGGHKMGRHQSGPQPERRLARLTQMLNLSQEQQDKLKPILQDEAKQMRAVHDDTSLTPEQRHSKMRELHQGTTTQINGILTPEQQTKWNEMREKMKERHQHKGAGAPQAPKS
jgi:periplasmic protein CpxP/Spy